MKLLRHGAPGEERPGLCDPEGRVRDLSAHVPDIAGEFLSPAGLSQLAGIDPATLPEVPAGTRIGPCVGSIGKIIGIGMNYSDHAAELGVPVPEEPIIFAMATSAICGPTDDLILPSGAEKVDWEVEIGVVIGTVARAVSEADALTHVAGYCAVNDISERAWQFDRGGQWIKGKSADTFAPIGPWLVTRDEIPDPNALDMWLDVDGVRQQTGNSAKMVFGVAHLVSYLSRFMTLHPGDLISTGTPPGVGQGKSPPTFLRPGQEMRLEVAGLGQQAQSVVASAG